MLILITSIVIGSIAGLAYYQSYALLPESIVVGFLIFVVSEALMRSVFNKPFRILTERPQTFLDLVEENRGIDPSL